MRADDSIANIIRSNSNCMCLPIPYLCKHEYISISLLLCSYHRNSKLLSKCIPTLHACRLHSCPRQTTNSVHMENDTTFSSSAKRQMIACVRTKIYANFEFECSVSVSMCRGHAFHVGNCRWNEICKKAVSNIICGTRCAMRTDLHVLFLVRIHHWTAQQTKKKRFICCWWSGGRILIWRC